MNERAAYPLAGALLAAAPLAAFLSGNNYPLAAPESIALLAGAAGAGLLLGLAASRSTILGALFLGTALALCVDLLYGAQLARLALVLTPLVCIALTLAFRRHAAAIVASVASTFLVATWLVPATDAHDAKEHERFAPGPGPGGVSLPVVLHIVLDEHIGLDGVPRELGQSEEFRRWLGKTYVDHGFRLYAGAYSEYFDTRNALANLFNFTSHDDPGSHLAPAKTRPYILTRSAYFRHLSERGYALRVYQSDHIDYCTIPAQPYASCVVYRSNSIAALDAAGLQPAERLQFVFNSFLETSAYYTRLRDWYGKLRIALPGLPAWPAGVSRVGPLAVLPIVQRLEADLRTAQPGDAYFAHLLIPHYPYVLDASCQPRAQIAHWLYNLPAAAKDLGNSAQSRAERYEHYFAQIRCQQALLARLFQAMKSAGVWERAIVVVHGDHGSRIVRTLPFAQNAARLTRADFNDAYSALFAVRKPGLQAGEVAGARPLQELLAEVFDISMQPLPPRVYLRARPGEPLLAFDPRRLP